MIESISRDKSTLYGGEGEVKDKKNTEIVPFVPTLLATIVAYEISRNSVLIIMCMCEYYVT